jgi:hypothetical protein
MRSASTLFVVTAFTLLAAGTAFATSAPPVQVPMPASLGLLVTGVVGLAVAGWWLRKR